MTYRYAVQRDDYSDLASGLVLRSAPGMPGFPVRLASEIFQRASEIHGRGGSLTVWDPCCGSGYLLTVMGLLHPGRIHTIVASDVDESALSLAKANLGLLTVDGLSARRQRLLELAHTHGKPSHHQAAQAAWRLLDRVRAVDTPPAVSTAVADVFDPNELAGALPAVSPDIVLTDAPYGGLTDWLGAPTHAEPIPTMAWALAAVVAPDTVLTISCRARRVPLGHGIRPAATLKVGHRSVAFLRARELTSWAGEHAKTARSSRRS